MSRSLYKIPFVHKSIFKKCLNSKKKKKLRVIESRKLKNISHYLYFWKRSSIINKNLLYKKIAIYNGKIFISLTVNKNHIGFFLGSFCLTRKSPAHKGKQKQQKKTRKAVNFEWKPKKKPVKKSVRTFAKDRYKKSISKRRR